MSFTKTSITVMYCIVTMVIVSIVTWTTFIAASDGVEINGKIEVHPHEMDKWNIYRDKLRITLSGKHSGEAAETVNENKNFSFTQINPEDVIEILWTHEESSEATHVLFPFNKEGSAETLSKGVVCFRFRAIDWVFLEFKKRASNAANMDGILDIDQIVTNAKQYHEILSNANNINKDKIDRLKHKLLQHICQKSENERRIERFGFNALSNVPIQRRWHVELLNVVSEDNYQQKYPADIIRSLNQWAIFACQSYTKYNSWADRDIIFSEELDSLFRDEASRELLYKDVLMISNILKNSSNPTLRNNNPFNTADRVNMNVVSNWIADINRQVKPSANESANE